MFSNCLTKNNRVINRKKKSSSTLPYLDFSFLLPNSYKKIFYQNFPYVSVTLIKYRLSFYLSKRKIP